MCIQRIICGFKNQFQAEKNCMHCSTYLHKWLANLRPRPLNMLYFLKRQREKMSNVCFIVFQYTNTLANWRITRILNNVHSTIPYRYSVLFTVHCLTLGKYGTDWRGIENVRYLQCLQRHDSQFSISLSQYKVSIGILVSI